MNFQMVKYLFVILGTYPGLVVNIEAKPEWGPVGTPLVVASEWNQLGPGLNGPVYEITIDGNDVYVGGGFLDAGGNPDADYVARWDGCEWHALGPGLNGDVKAITVSGDNIYIGGSFTQPFNYIARWDGAQWSPMGPGPGNIV